MRHVVFCGDKELYYHNDETFGRINIILSQSLILFIVLIHEMPDIVLAVKAITDSELVISKFKLFLKV